MIHVFHGFLGSPEDFKFLEAPGVILHDVYRMEEFPAITPDDTLIGYSLGGRIALDIAHKNHFSLKKIVLMNAHPGLSTDQERLARKNFEATVLQELEQKNLAEFMTWWNELPIFLFDSPMSLNDQERYRQSAKMFERFRLSNQHDHLPELIQHKEKVLWIIGSQDEKYDGIARHSLIPHGITVKYIDAGHRLFQHPDKVLAILRDEKIL